MQRVAKRGHGTEDKRLYGIENNGNVVEDMEMDGPGCSLKENEQAQGAALFKVDSIVDRTSTPVSIVTEYTLLELLKLVISCSVVTCWHGASQLLLRHNPSMIVWK